MPFDLGAPQSPERQAFIEEGPWQTCPLCHEQSGSWEWLEEHIMACDQVESDGTAARWQARWCPACGNTMTPNHDPDTCIEERAAG